MPNPGDGFTVVTAMRHSQPNALTLLVSGYPDVQSAMAAILLEADEIIVKPFEVGKLAELVHEKMLTANLPPVGKGESGRDTATAALPVSSTDWLARAKKTMNSTTYRSATKNALDIFPSWFEDLVVRLSKPSATTKDSDAAFSEAAVAHGKLRYQQGYTPAMLVHESRILQVTLFGTLQSNVRSVGFQLAPTRCHDHCG